ncbi:MAG: endonuclease/exonuclease/phosphatase family protein [Lacibacter sp.]|jgi:endonuclease/exonuclease/phosphatase family metal-dependent hydrolase
MKGILRFLTKQFFITTNLLVSIPMLLLYALPYSNQQYFWMLNLFALLFPYLCLVQVAFLLFWLLAKPRLSLIPLATLVVCYPLMRNVVGLHTPEKQIPAAAGSFRVATWNVHLFDFYENRGNLDPQMLQKARELSADILCIQELVFSTDSTSNMSLDQVRKRLGFNYVVAGNDRAFGVHTNINTQNEKYFPFCVAILSKHPIVRWQKVQSLPEYNHTFLWADIALGNDTLRVFNVHLQSMHFVKKDYDFIENIDRQEMEEVKRQGRNIIRKIKAANLLRAQQIDDVRNEVLKSPYPVILTGDFNDVPNSYAYQTMRRHLQDVFVQKGWGLGRTFQLLAPTLRIDYIFHAPELQLQQFRMYNWGESDHKPLVAVFARPQ